MNGSRTRPTFLTIDIKSIKYRKSIQRNYISQTFLPYLRFRKREMGNIVVAFVKPIPTQFRRRKKGSYPFEFIIKPPFTLCFHYKRWNTSRTDYSNHISLSKFENIFCKGPSSPTPSNRILYLKIIVFRNDSKLNERKTCIVFQKGSGKWWARDKNLVFSLSGEKRPFVPALIFLFVAKFADGFITVNYLTNGGKFSII